MLVRSLLTACFLGTLISLCAACGGDDEDGADMSRCPATTCSSSQVFNTKTCQCDTVDLASSDR